MSALSNCVTCGMVFQALAEMFGGLAADAPTCLAFDLAPTSRNPAARVRFPAGRAAPLAAAAWPLLPMLFMIRFENSFTSSW